MAQSTPLSLRLQYNGPSAERGEQQDMMLQSGTRSFNSLLGILRVAEAFFVTAEGLLIKMRESVSQLDGRESDYLCRAIQTLTNGNPAVFPIRQPYVIVQAAGVKWEILVRVLTAISKIQGLLGVSRQAVRFTMEGSAIEDLHRDLQRLSIAHRIEHQAANQGAVITLEP